MNNVSVFSKFYDCFDLCKTVIFNSLQKFDAIDQKYDCELRHYNVHLTVHRVHTHITKNLIAIQNDCQFSNFDASSQTFDCILSDSKLCSHRKIIGI